MNATESHDDDDEFVYASREDDDDDATFSEDNDEFTEHNHRGRANNDDGDDDDTFADGNDEFSCYDPPFKAEALKTLCLIIDNGKVDLNQVMNRLKDAIEKEEIDCDECFLLLDKLVASGADEERVMEMWDKIIGAMSNASMDCSTDSTYWASASKLATHGMTIYYAGDFAVNVLGPLLRPVLTGGCQLLTGGGTAGQACNQMTTIVNNHP
jgi:hypothetical protein